MIDHTDVVIIGRGCVGAGIARDLSMRGVSCILLRWKDPAYGFTSRCSGLLQSGALYAVEDPVAARENSSENHILRRIAAQFVGETNGLFVRLPGNDNDCVTRFLEALRQVGIPARRLSAGKALEQEPSLNPDVIEAIAVQDAVANPYTLALANARSAVEHGAQVRTDTTVVSLVVEAGEVRGVRARCERTGEDIEIHARCVINAAGDQAGTIAAMAGICLPLRFFRLSFVLIDSRLTRGAVHRCLPGSLGGDIVVPSGSKTILRAAAKETPNQDYVAVGPDEVERLIEQTGRIVPGIKEARAVRAFSTIQTFLEIQRSPVPREACQGIVVMDHGIQDGVGCLYTVLGGTLTTHRLAAQLVSDAVCRRLGITAPCVTHRETLPRVANLQMDDAPGVLPPGLSIPEALKPGDEIVCRCKNISNREIEETLQDHENVGLADIQHLTGAGNGKCQGGLCAAIIMGILHDKGRLPEDRSNRKLRAFLEERWKGIRPVARGELLREEELIRAVMLETFNLDHAG